MAYFTDLFSPETYEAFGRSDRTVSGFRMRQRNIANRIKPGDKLVCYMTKLSRWGGILEVVEGPFIDADPFVVRFRVNPTRRGERENTAKHTSRCNGTGSRVGARFCVDAKERENTPENRADKYKASTESPLASPARFVIVRRVLKICADCRSVK
jgi:hypothetical protein